MTPHPDEIAYVLAAPEAVREALRGVSGPGWSYLDLRPDLPEGARWMLLPRATLPGYGPCWLPVSEVAIVAEAARRARGDGEWLIGGAEGVVARASSGYGAIAPTARLAAMRLLAAVVGA